MTCELAIRVVPRASKAGVAGTRDHAILVRIAAGPGAGAAQGERVVTQARALNLPRRALTITSGTTSRNKRVRVDGLSRDAALQKLGVTA